MNKPLKTVVAFALAFTAAGLFATSGNAKADIIDVPGATKSIPQVNAGNVLTNYDSSDLKDINNTSPVGNMDRKYNQGTIDPNVDNPGDTFATTSATTTTANSFKTQWFLPDGFNVTDYQHGNFQSVALDDSGNVYFVESNGSDTNLGVIIKFDTNKLKQLGLENDPMALWKAFNYFNPYTEDGIAHNNQYDDLYESMKDSFKDVKSLSSQLATVKSDMNDLRNAKRTAQSKLKKASSTTKKHLTAVLKSNATQSAADQKKAAALEKKAASAQSQIDKLKSKNPDLFKNIEVAETAQLSPQVDIGHGQTLTFNPQNKHLYLVEDNTLTDLRNRDENNNVLEIDPNTMDPIRQYNFKMFQGTKGNLQLHTLAFDKNGNAYWGRKNGMGYMIFYGRLDENGVKFAAAPEKLKTRGGSPNQGVAFNNVNNRIYVVSDDVLTSIPIDKLVAGTATPDDVNYSVFQSKREWECLAFDSQGYGHLLALWPAELMKTTAPLN
ncbi:hypothetical protein [Lentilactobacillus otakiensis]|uniref:hypothetical protein n=1 Tax=Lentilactobacillus otakiensis TaxID=481720 RepID=UPI003D17CA49